ncbi:hypothetical protein RsTz2092_11380 [Deferribacterales bacterium RsTz2092]|nr:hypothetical protein AGMMS49941_09470 [Deferribacterales bacterium]
MANKKINFEDKMKRLEEIVTNMESGTILLDEVAVLFKEGAVLSKECKAELDKLNAVVKEVQEGSECNEYGNSNA